MLGRLIARLTGDPMRGQAMFDRAVAEARQPHWYVEGEVADSTNGRFAMLATIVALVTVRLEQWGAEGEAASVALTERFVATMDAEVRQMGVSDPSIGKHVRGLVGALAKRVGEWRSTTSGDEDWQSAVIDSVYRGQRPGEAALRHSVDSIRAYWSSLEAAPPESVAAGTAP
jgi:cytochrome b pre-mRNA-processing protein 3